VSLVWTTIVLLVLLLPGFLFFVGLYSTERMSRDLAGGALGQLAGVVLVAFLSHGILYLLLLPGCRLWAWFPCISLPQLASVLQLTGLNDELLGALDTMFQRNGLWIFLYVITTSGAGYLLGKAGAMAVLRGWFRGLAKHQWVYSLVAVDRRGGPVHVFVLTDIRQDERLLMYRGFLREFYVAPDGRIAYLVLTEALRYYLLLAKDAPTTSPEADWKPVGAAAPIANPGASGAGAPRPHSERLLSYLVIDGKDIANVTFDAFRRITYSKPGMERLDAALAQRAREADATPAA
jgi:hypothetical protein